METVISSRRGIKVVNPDLRVVTLNSLVIPDNAAMRRVARTPLKHRREDFEEQFDDTTLFYDIFQNTDGDLVMCGPPAWNLEREIFFADYVVDGAPVGSRPTIREFDRCSLSVLPIDRGQARSLDLTIFEHSLRCDIGETHTDAFKDSRAVLTINKNNDLEWIRDWAEFYVKLHGADSFLLFDNASTHYSCSELVESVYKVEGLARFWVAPFPFSFGPTNDKAGIWDSNFLQISMLKLAQLRFLAGARSVLSVDIDELVLPAGDGTSVFETTERSDTGYISFSGSWIEPVVDEYDETKLYRHRDLLYRLTTARTAANKWCVCPPRCSDQNQWLVHKINRLESSDQYNFSYRHFSGISTNWKYNRNISSILDRSKYVKDNFLIKCYDTIGWS